MKYNVELEEDKPCWLKKYGCPCSTGSCYGLPDDGCPVYEWFKCVMMYQDRKARKEYEESILRKHKE